MSTITDTTTSTRIHYYYYMWYSVARPPHAGTRKARSYYPPPPDCGARGLRSCTVLCVAATHMGQPSIVPAARSVTAKKTSSAQVSVGCMTLSLPTGTTRNTILRRLCGLLLEKQNGCWPEGQSQSHPDSVATIPLHALACSAGLFGWLGLARPLSGALFMFCQNNIFLSQQSAGTVFFSPAEQALLLHTQSWMFSPCKS